MASFKALNVETDSESENEIDDTEEIQIEDALKLYQIALKYHSEGPRSYEKASEAYDELMGSDIFTNPDLFPEHARVDKYGIAPNPGQAEADDADGTDTSFAPQVDSTPDTLPQILHLSYKNYGQFLLDRVEHEFRTAGRESISQADLVAAIADPLNLFADALNKDPTDLELWRRIASLALLLGNKRIARYCYEVVLDSAKSVTKNANGVSGPDEWIAGLGLRRLLESINDECPTDCGEKFTARKSGLFAALHSQLTPYPGFPTVILPQSPLGMEPDIVNLTPKACEWEAVGDSILKLLTDHQNCEVNYRLGYGVVIHLSPPSSIFRPVRLEHDKTAAIDVVLGESSAKFDVDMPDVGEDTEIVDGTSQKPQSKRAGAVETPSTSSDSRKRSIDSSGVQEPAEGGRSRSKRIKARESIMDGGNAQDHTLSDNRRDTEERLKLFSSADTKYLEVLGSIFNSFGVKPLDPFLKYIDFVNMGDGNLYKKPESVIPMEKNAAVTDVFNAVLELDHSKLVMMLDEETAELNERNSTREVNIQAFFSKKKIRENGDSETQMAKDVFEFCEEAKKQRLTILDISWKYLERLLSPPVDPELELPKSFARARYRTQSWSPRLKLVVLELLARLDDEIYDDINPQITLMDEKLLEAQLQGSIYSPSADELSLFTTLQTICELHLDLLSIARSARPGCRITTVEHQGARVERWILLLHQSMAIYCSFRSVSAPDELMIRYLWTFTLFLSGNQDVDRRRLVAYFDDIKDLLEESGSPTYEFRNSEMIPEISVSASGVEKLKITLTDIILRMFDDSALKKPDAIISTLESMIDPATSFGIGDELSDPGEIDINQIPSPICRDMVTFLDKADVSLRLALWARLREIYETIDYPPRIVSCNLRMIEILMQEFHKPSYMNLPNGERFAKLFSTIRLIDRYVRMVLVSSVTSPTNAFNFLDIRHLKTSLAAMVEFIGILQGFTTLEDEIRVGRPSLFISSLGSSSFGTVRKTIQDYLARALSLLYKLIIDSMLQSHDAFPDIKGVAFSFIQSSHHVLGIRGICSASNMVFLRIAMRELVCMDPGDEVDAETSQVIYDMYGLNCSPYPDETGDHETTAEPLDKKISARLLDFLLRQSKKVSIKDLHKTDLRSTIDKVHSALGRTKPNEVVSRNRKIYSSFLKSPIVPTDLFRTLEGVGSLSMTALPKAIAPAASNGWYFLMGMISLTKHRSQKRTAGASTDDLTTATAFFAQDLESAPDKWESWYRAAQTFDHQLEENVSWSAEKMNGSGLELINLQRSAIHCYSMALVNAICSDDEDPEKLSKMNDLYFDFGMRIYASSREPFSMAAFALKSSEQKYFSSDEIYKGNPHSELGIYSAWKFAAVLFMRAVNGGPNWQNHYMLGKCLWKMHTASDLVRISRDPPGCEAVLKSFMRSVFALPKRDSRRDPILEPHIKMASTLHKLVQRKEIKPQEACEILETIPICSKVTPSVEDPDDWEEYILKVLKTLKNADKSGLHHRMTARAAHVIYDECKNDLVAVAGAKLELSHQIFTKAMAISVWRPDFERPGRHFVYVSRYTCFFINLLVQAGDHDSLEMLARRIRKKPHEFFNHPKVWSELCQGYSKVLRWMESIPDRHEENVLKNVNFEEFSQRANILESWSQQGNESNAVLDILREAVELKKLNGGLVKLQSVDELIGDAYAALYASVLPGLLHQASATSTPQSGSKLAPVGNNVMALNNLVNNSDEGPTSQVSTPGKAATVAKASTGSLATQPTSGTDGPPAAAPQLRIRFKAVGRREIHRRAEAAVAKPTISTAPLRPPTRPSDATVLVVIEQRSPEASASAAATAAAAAAASSPSRPRESTPTPATATTAAAAAAVNPDPSTQIRAGATSPRHAHPAALALALAAVTTTASGGVESSAAGSVYDSADDESELSELDDVVVGVGVGGSPLFPRRVDRMVGVVLGDDEAEDTGGD